MRLNALLMFFLVSNFYNIASMYYAIWSMHVNVNIHLWSTEQHCIFSSSVDGPVVAAVRSHSHHAAAGGGQGSVPVPAARECQGHWQLRGRHGHENRPTHWRQCRDAAGKCFVVISDYSSRIFVVGSGCRCRCNGAGYVVGFFSLQKTQEALSQRSLFA